MRIAFDLSPLSHAHPRGLARAAEGATRALEARGKLEVVRLTAEPGESLRAFRHGRLASLVRARACAGVHSFVSSVPLFAGVPRVQTVHEIPWAHGVAENAGALHRAWALVGAWCTARTCVPSETVASDLYRHRIGGKSRVRVTPWGVGPPFTADPEEGEIDELVPLRLELPRGAFVLCPGAVRPKKNLAAVLAGMGELAARGGPRLDLVVTGPDSHALLRNLDRARTLGLEGCVRTPGEVGEAELAALYRQAVAVPVLSLSEGFAFPVLEALACGAPVLVPRDSAQAELAGRAGIEVDPADPVSVAAGFARAQNERWRLAPLGFARAAEFTWERCAERIEAVWGEIL